MTHKWEHKRAVFEQWMIAYEGDFNNEIVRRDEWRMYVHNVCNYAWHSFCAALDHMEKENARLLVENFEYHEARKRNTVFVNELLAEIERMKATTRRLWDALTEIQGNTKEQHTADTCLAALSGQSPSSAPAEPCKHSNTYYDAVAQVRVCQDCGRHWDEC